MTLVDNHAHLYWESFQEDFDQVIQRSLDNGVSTLINVGVDVEKSQMALDQVQNQLSKFAGLTAYSTIGIHPHEAVKFNDQTLATAISELEKIYLSNPQKVAAVGECGLDFFFDNNPDLNPTNLSEDEQKVLQRKLLKAQIDLAKKLSVPLIIHCRDDRSKNPENSEAWDEILKMVGTHPTILHCYSGLPPTTNYILQTTNLVVSFAGTLTYPKNEYLREAAKLLPLDRIILETDCPFLPPQSKRGTRNEPANVKEIAELLAELRGVSLEEISTTTTNNVKIIFGL